MSGTESVNNWNISQLYRAAKRELAALSDVPQTEAMLLCGRFLGVNDRTELLMRGDEPVAAEQAQAFLEALAQRPDRPLQYILGEWPFDGMLLSVGEGVLVPREDTLALVELACESIRDLKASLTEVREHRIAMTEGATPQSLRDSPLGEGAFKASLTEVREHRIAMTEGATPRPLHDTPIRILDLCAGTGAVGLAVARRIPTAQVTCVELSDEALPYLRANVEKYGDGRVTVLKGDVLAGCEALGFAPGSVDAVLSNPPYIPAGDIPGLAREVRQEPAMALDGGKDGLDFYRAIAERWQPAVRSGGLLCYELGAGQFEDVKRIIVRSGWCNIGLKRDFGDKIRAIVGTKR